MTARRGDKTMNAIKMLVLAFMLSGIFSVPANARGRHHRHHRHHHHRHNMRRYKALWPFHSVHHRYEHRHNEFSHQWFSSGHNSLVAIARQYIGDGKFTRFRGPWCRDALNVWLRRAGLYTDGDRRAFDSRNLGTPTRAAPGMIGYKRHHTGVVARVSGNIVWLISGNHSHRVQLSPYPLHSLRYVRPH